jgi:thiamine-monophosphate kinase
MTAVLEHQLIGRLVAGLPRSPLQLNGLHESDAELVALPGSDIVLAVTTDALAEELATGLYCDPWLIGWMLVMVNASDLAAVGADPLGILLCESLPPDAAPDWVDALQRGIAEAAIATGLAVLGGDTNASPVPHLAATAIGLVQGPPPLTRRGCHAGDRLYASAPLGAGGAYACIRLLRPAAGGAEFPFRPVARMAEGRLLRGRASACMDTSDGAIATLDELMARNGVGFLLDTPLEDWTDRHAAQLARSAGLEPWMLHAGPHGEFELLFSVPPACEAELLRAAADIGWVPVRLGSATAAPGLTLTVNGAPHPVDARRLRNLFTECGGNPREYVANLLRQEEGANRE